MIFEELKTVIRKKSCHFECDFVYTPVDLYGRFG